MPTSKKRRVRNSRRNTVRSGNPMSHKNRPMVFGGLHPLEPSLGVVVPAPMVSQRRTPPGHLANLQAFGKDTLFGFAAMETIPQLSQECISLLTEASGGSSASQALVELMMNRVVPKRDLIAWLENHYLGTWDEPYQSVTAIAGPAATSALTREQLVGAYRRATQAFMLREHYFESGRVAVSFTQFPGTFGFWVITDWVLEGRIPASISLK